MSTQASNVPLAPRKEVEDVWKYPRPPALQRTPNRLRVVWTALDGTETVIADTENGFRVLETTHPPTYYLPPDSIKVPLGTTSKRTFCEASPLRPVPRHQASADSVVEGSATYHTISPPGATKPISNRIWSYGSPTTGFKPLKDYLSFYASSGLGKEEAGGEWRCFVDDEIVGKQEGDFYGGWVTSNIQGKMKGGPGTWGW